MRITNIGGYRTVDAYVAAKTERLRTLAPTFAALFDPMFSERENILWEESRGYRITKTTYGEAREAALGYAAALRGLLSDLPENSPVGLAVPNSVEWIELLWAVLAAGYCPLLINPRLGRDLLEKTLRENGVGTVIAADGEFPGDPGSFRVISLSSLTPVGDAPVPPVFGSEIYVLSGGTSSHVKCCAYGAAQLICQIEDSSRIIRECRKMKKHYKGELKHLALLPLCHIFGLSAVYFWFAYFSRTFVGLADLSPKTVQNTVRRHGVTHIFAVPLFWEKTYAAAMRGIRERGEKTEKKFEKGMRISRALDFWPTLCRVFGRIAFRELREEMFGESISFLISGGSAIDPIILEFFNRIGYRLANGYGMSEIGITSLEMSWNIRKLSTGSVGQPFASVRYKEEDGRLFVGGKGRASSVVSEGVRVPLGEFYDTRDLCEPDPVSGGWRILGRSDDLVVGAAGENLNPNLIEPRFANCGAAGVCLCAVPKEGGFSSLLLVSVHRYLTEEACREVLAKTEEVCREQGLQGLIDRTVLTFAPLMEPDDFKMNRRRIAERYAAGEIVPVSFKKEHFEAKNAEMLAKIRDAFRLSLGVEEDFSDTADYFTDLGGSSFDWYGMTAALGEALDVPYPKTPAGLSTVKDIYTFTEAYFEKNLD